MCPFIYEKVIEYISILLIKGLFCLQQWYQLSKTLAEEAALEFAKENGIDLVTLHPGLVIGPLLQPTLNSSCESIVNFIKEGKHVQLTP